MPGKIALERVLLWASLAAGTLNATGCRAHDPPSTPEEVCARACVNKAPHCSEAGCLRGCNLALDKWIEREGDAILACVAREKPGCDDSTWAKCAVRTGPHKDGGPPAPPPPKDEEM